MTSPTGAPSEVAVIEATEEAEGAIPTGTAPETPEAPPSPESEPAAASLPASTDDPGVQTPPVPSVFQPPEGAKPFAFKLDGAEVPLPGAVEVDDYLIVPKQALSEFRTQVGNRSQWGRERSQYQRRIGELEAAAHDAPAEKQKYQVLSQKMLTLLNDPEALAEFAQNHQTRLPILVAEVRAEQAELRAKQFEEQQAAAQRAQQEEQLKPYAYEAMCVGVESILEEMGATALLPGSDGEFPKEAKELAAYLWGLQEKGVQLVRLGPDGYFQPDRDELYRLMQREVAKAQRKAEQSKTTEVKKAQNAAAVAPTKPATGPTKPVSKPATTKTPATEPDYRTDPQAWEEWFRKV